VRIAVLGASGLIGAHVVRSAITAGHDAVAVLRPTSNLAALQGLAVPTRHADVLGRPDELAEKIADADAVVHTAAMFTYSGDAAKLHDLAVRGTETVLRAAKVAGVRRIVVTSSSVVFGHTTIPRVIDETAGLADPAGEPPYIAAKIAQHRQALELAEALDLDLVLACPTMSIGPHATTLGPSNGAIVAYLSDPLRLTFPGGCNLVSARDVGAAHVMLVERAKAREAYLLGSGNLTWTDIHAFIGELTGVGGPHVELNHFLAYCAATAEELRARLAGRPALSSRQQASMIGRFYWYSHTRAATLGYAPTPVREALIEAISWLASSSHIVREVRASLRLADEIYFHRYGGPPAARAGR
jgi:dihydroflavonol-4-reductase